MPEQPVRIGAGSWLGHGTVVLPGATIGRHVVIGANSVVRGTIPDFCVAAGNPARSVKTLVPSDGRRNRRCEGHTELVLTSEGQRREVVGRGAGRASRCRRRSAPASR